MLREKLLTIAIVGLNVVLPAEKLQEVHGQIYHTVVKKVKPVIPSQTEQVFVAQLVKNGIVKLKYVLKKRHHLCILLKQKRYHIQYLQGRLYHQPRMERRFLHLVMVVYTIRIRYQRRIQVQKRQQVGLILKVVRHQYPTVHR